MDEEQRRHLDDLLQINQRRLRPLERKAAALGLNTPPEVLVEIEDIRAQIERITRDLEKLNAHDYEGSRGAFARETRRPSHIRVPHRSPPLLPRSRSIPWRLSVAVFPLLIIALFWGWDRFKGDTAPPVSGEPQVSSVSLPSPLVASTPASSTIDRDTPTDGVPLAPSAAIEQPVTMIPASLPIVGFATPLSGRIAFVSNRDGNYEIYVANTDGSGLMNVTNHIGDDRSPALSPDGKRIAFLSDRDSRPYMNEIYIVNADGSGQSTRLTYTTVDEGVPTWSLDGQHIAFQSYDNTGNLDIYVLDVGHPEQITRLTTDNSEDMYPSWSKDGRYIAFQSHRDGNWEIYIMDTQGNQVTNLTRTPEVQERGPTWSANSQRIAYTVEHDGQVDLYTMNADGSQQTALTHTRDENEWAPTWSPDGRYIACHIGNQPPRKIAVINTDNGYRESLIAGNADYYFPSWSAISR